MEKARARRSRVGRPLVCALFMLFAAALAAGQDVTESPTSWSPTQNVRWKTALQGIGHSSPIVADSHVYVTTAFEAAGTKPWLRAARWLRSGLSLAALVLWLWLPPARVRWQGAAVGGLLAVSVVLALGDERLLHLTRSPSRGWLGAGASLLVGLLLCAYGLEARRWARRGVALALGLLGLGLLAGRPAGIDETTALAAALAVLIVGALAGCALVLRGLFASRAGSRAPVRPVWRATVLLAAGLGFVVPAVLVPRSGWVYAVACLDRSTGRVLWLTEGLRAAPSEVHSVNSQATPTAVTDGGRIFAHFGNPGLMAVDADGTLLWTNSQVPFQTIDGAGASPVLAQDMLVVSVFKPGAPYLAAFDVATGREIWWTTRPTVHPESGDSRTPLVQTINGRATVVAWGREEIAGYDLKTGDALWRYVHGPGYLMGSMASSLVAHGDSLYLPLENGIVAMSASRLASGRDPLLWTSKGGGSARSTPVYYEDRIYAVSAAGVVSCTDARTGDLVWHARLTGEFRSSPVAAAGKVYFTNDAGRTTVLSAGPRYQVLAENELGESVTAALTPFEGGVYARTLHHLFRIGP